MGLFSFTQEIAMDLGTANTIILNNGNIRIFVLYVRYATGLLPTLMPVNR